MTDKQIKTIEDLAKLSDNRKAVIIPGTVWDKPKPASVILHLPGMIILNLLKKGIYLYTPKNKEDKNGREKTPR